MDRMGNTGLVFIFVFIVNQNMKSGRGCDGVSCGFWIL